MTRIQWHTDKFMKDLDREINTRLKRVGVMLRRKIVRKISKPSRQRRSRPGEPPRADRGRLRQSIFWDLNERKQELIVGTTAIYGGALELGATILPKKAKALSVPVSDEARRHAGSPRTFPKPLVLIQRPGRAPLLIEAKKRMTVVHYVLLPVVHLGKRPYILATLNENMAKVRAIMIRGGRRGTGRG